MFKMFEQSMDQKSITTLRMLAVDMIETANSGHPGLPLGAAPMAYVLWSRFLRVNPSNPNWINRDRFILSAGHGSALLYAMMHLMGYDLSLDDLKQFRQWGSRTPGHPEYGLPLGVEATTGPLGQGFSMAVGVALAERYFSNRFNKDQLNIIDYYTYVLASDGDLMEGVAGEAASFAGHQQLGKLIVLYDDNKISIEGNTDLTFTENVCDRFTAMHWHVQVVEDGNDVEAISLAIERARSYADKPSLIAVRTHIGFGSPKVDSPKAHGEPLGSSALLATKEYFQWPVDQSFFVPEDVRRNFSDINIVGAEVESEWQRIMMEYRRSYPEESKTMTLEMAGVIPEPLAALEVDFGTDCLATRSASGKVLNALSEYMPNLIGGSADLAPSNNTILHEKGDMSSGFSLGRNIHFGIREHAMGAIVNGMALCGGAIPFGATFLVFSDYMRPAIRLSALMKLKSIWIFTHDSIALGEDGPTHQPIEHLASLRAIPDLAVFRPADAYETEVAWKMAVHNASPSAIVLTRQKLPLLDAGIVRNRAMRGAYILQDSDGEPDTLLIATGSEVHIALEAACQLKGEGYQVRVISMLSQEVFSALEAASTFGWDRWTGSKGRVLGIDHFGASAPGDVLIKQFGLTPEHVVACVKEELCKQG
jgi:transketolase